MELGALLIDSILVTDRGKLISKVIIRAMISNAFDITAGFLRVSNAMIFTTDTKRTRCHFEA